MKIDFDKIMMAVIIVLVAAFLLMMGGCERAVTGPPLASECTFETPLNVSVVEYETQAEIAAKWEYYNRQKLPAGATVKGFATYNLVTQVHTLHVLKVRGQQDHDRIETIGHELLHSFCGDWHPPTVASRGLVETKNIPVIGSLVRGLEYLTK